MWFMRRSARSGKSPCDATCRKNQRRTLNVESVRARGAQDVEDEKVNQPEAEREQSRGGKELQGVQPG
jgi:hypothetical protein